MLNATRKAVWLGARGGNPIRGSHLGNEMILSSLRMVSLRAGFKHRPKRVTPESYVKFTEIVDGQVVEKEENEVEDLFKVVKPQKDSKPIDRSLKASGSRVPVPCSPTLGPITVDQPEAFSKKYKWCSCGMSSKQVRNQLTISHSVI
jgi:hypothetical protein